MLVSLSIISSVLVVSNAQPVKAQSSNAIYIRQDGSVDPSTVPIQRSGDIYTLTGNIAGNITVQKYNIVIDGAGYTLQGLGVAGEGQPMRSTGIDLHYQYDVTIKNIRIRNFDQGIHIGNSFGTIITGNDITDNGYGIAIFMCSTNKVIGNNITNNSNGGIWIGYSSNEVISSNFVTNNAYGVFIDRSTSTMLKNNSMVDNGQNRAR